MELIDLTVTYDNNCKYSYQRFKILQDRKFGKTNSEHAKLRVVTGIKSV